MKVLAGMRNKGKGGSAMVELGLMLPLLFVLLFGAGDFGRAYYMSITLANAAAAGALYGVQSVANSTDTTGITNAAKADATNLQSVTITSSRFCQCADGTAISCTSTCTSPNPARPRVYVSVTATKNFKSLVGYPKDPGNFTIGRTVTMRAR
jgi:Flp pilus assembly protein TadG